ncbi:redox-active disulfide protein 2 [Fibrella aquatica]|uniref:redox-active disulfide protein 2 n=1 Tax=Fibrella aquatica TaxID=3242487 RepID=UPI003520EFCD
MENTKFREMSNEKLLEQKKLTQTVTGALGGMLTLLLAAVVFLTIQQGFNAVNMSLGVIPFALMPILFINWNSVKEIQKELDSRKKTVN